MTYLLVYVVNQNGQCLMPCKPAKARKLLRDKRARVIKRSPFTIQLLWDCEEHVQEITVGIDKGSHVTGFSCVENGQVLLSGEIHHRLDVKEKMDARRTHRRSRRNRLWHRPPCWRNRASSKRSGRIPPTIKTNAKEVIRVVQQLPLPVVGLVIEDVQVDMARLNDPTLQGSRYQDPSRLDENLRMACLMRDGYQTATWRKAQKLPKEHDADALCLATYTTGELVPYQRERFFTISFRPRQTRRRFLDVPQKGKGRVRYQVNEQLDGFRKGDIVRVKERYVKQINSIYSTGYLAFPRVKGEPANAQPKDCRLLERGRTILWERKTGEDRQEKSRLRHSS